MICRQCGRYLPDGSRFCPSCGLTVQTPPQYPVAPLPPVYQPVYQYVPQPLEQPDSPHLAALKKLARSPMMLIAVIGYTLGIIGGLINTIAVNYDLKPLMDYLYAVFEVNVSNDITSNVIFNVFPTVLIAVGLWITYGCARKKTGMSTAGINMIKVMNIINLVIICLISTIFLISYLTIATSEPYAGLGAVFMTAVLIAGLIIAAVIAFGIVLQARIIGSLNAASAVINTGRPTKKVSVLLAVVLIISAICSLATGFFLMSVGGILPELKGMIAQIPQLAQFPIELLNASTAEALLVVGIPYLISAVTSFLFALLIFRFRANVQNLVVQSPAPAEPFAPVFQPAVAPVVTAAPAEGVPVEETPAEEPAAEETPAEEPAVEETPAEDPIVEETLPEEPAVEETLAEDPAVEETPAEEPAVEETPVEEPIVEEVSAEEPVVEEIPAPAPMVEELPAFIYCIECGQKLVATAKFCSRCGHPQK